MNGFFDGILAFIYYLTPLALIMLFVRKFTKIPDELFRKSLHFILLGAYIPLLFGFPRIPIFLTRSTSWVQSVFRSILLSPVLRCCTPRSRERR